MNRYREERGQAFVLTAILLVSLIGMAALVLDVGHWYRSKRDLQAIADASALAGAQELPVSTGLATAKAVQYAHDNDGPAPEVSFSTKFFQNDTITVRVSRTEQGAFSGLFKLGSVQVGSHAVARAAPPAAVRWVAPIVVNQKNPQLACVPPPCSGTTELDLIDLHGPGSGAAAGSFGLLDLRQGSGGNPGENDLADWMENGYDDYMNTGKYFEAPSTNWNSSGFQQAMHDHIGDVVLFPVYKPPVIGGGSGAQFNIVGWVGFVIETIDASGANGTLTGHFVSYTTDAIPANTNPGPNFGLHTIQLVE